MATKTFAATGTLGTRISFDRDQEFTDVLVQENAHPCLNGFVLEKGRLSLTVMPDQDRGEEIVATFDEVQMQNFDIFTEPENETGKSKSRDLPWDIIGLNCLDHQGGLSFFCIHCQQCEMVFLSRWPHIKKKPLH